MSWNMSHPNVPTWSLDSMTSAVSRYSMLQKRKTVDALNFSAFSAISWMFPSCLPRTNLSQRFAAECNSEEYIWIDWDRLSTSAKSVLHCFTANELSWCNLLCQRWADRIFLGIGPRCCFGKDKSFFLYWSCLETNQHEGMKWRRSTLHCANSDFCTTLQNLMCIL